MSFTINEIVLLAVTLLIGLVLGGMMGRGRKYKRLWRDDSRAHALAIKERDTRLEAANARIADMERNQRPVGRASDRDGDEAVNVRDALTRIRTISAADEGALYDAGYHRYRQIAVMTDEQQATIEGRLGLRPGVITRDEWREQARLLDAGNVEDHARLYDRRMTPV